MRQDVELYVIIDRSLLNSFPQYKTVESRLRYKTWLLAHDHDELQTIGTGTSSTLRAEWLQRRTSTCTRRTMVQCPIHDVYRIERGNIATTVRSVTATDPLNVICLHLTDVLHGTPRALARICACACQPLSTCRQSRVNTTLHKRLIKISLKRESSPITRRGVELLTQLCKIRHVVSKKKIFTTTRFRGRDQQSTGLSCSGIGYGYGGSRVAGGWVPHRPINTVVY